MSEFTSELENIMPTKIEKICEFCGRTFLVKRYRENTARFCSRSCGIKWQIKFQGFGRKTRFTRERMLGNKSAKGHTPWNKGLKGIRLSSKPPPIMRGKENPKWVEPIRRICESCGEIFYKKPWELRNHRGRFCSVTCKTDFYIKSGHLLNMSRKAHKVPTNAEKRFMEICISHRLPFKFVGDGSFWIGRANPDFICESKKIAVEIMSRYHHNFFKLFEYGKLLPWFKTPIGRIEYLEKRGWKCIVLPDNFTEKDALEEVSKYERICQ